MARWTSETYRGAAAFALLLATATGSAQDAYPTDIAPPPGTRYPCALTARPRGLPGIRDADRAYLDRTYARILRATQAKLVLLKALEERREIGPARNRYQEVTAGLAACQRDDRPPAGLEPFHEDILAALALQQTFFSKAAPLREAGRGMDVVYSIVEGREASARLVAAWARMGERYPGWPPETRESIYHHLCALDLF